MIFPISFLHFMILTSSSKHQLERTQLSERIIRTNLDFSIVCKRPNAISPPLRSSIQMLANMKNIGLCFQLYLENQNYGQIKCVEGIRSNHLAHIFKSFHYANIYINDGNCCPLIIVSDRHPTQEQQWFHVAENRKN